MSDFLAELRRRRVFHTAVVYAVVAGGVWGAAEVAVPALGLPDAVITFIVVATLIGFPVALVLAWFFEVRLEETPGAARAEAPVGGGDSDAGGAGAAGASSTPVARRRWGLVAVGVAVVLASSAAILGLRPRASMLEAGAQVLLADAQASEEDADIGVALRQLLFDAFAGSDEIRLVPDRAIADALTRMEREPGQAVTGEVAREIAVRDGYAATLEPAISRVGNQWVMSVDLVDPGTGSSLASPAETAEGAEEVMSSLVSLVDRLRRATGERLTDVETREPLWNVTTDSLAALTALARGMQALTGRGDGSALRFFEEAVRVDGTFPIAHMMLGVSLWNADAWTEAAESFTRAYELRDKVTQHERLRIEGNYHLIVTGELGEARDAFLELRTRGSGDPFFLGQLANIEAASHRYAAAVEWVAELRERQGRLYPNQLYNLAEAQLMSGRDEEADATLDELEREYGVGSVLAPRYITAWQRGEWGSVELLLDSLLASGIATPEQANGRLGQVRVTQGRVDEGSRLMDEAGWTRGMIAIHRAYLDLELGRDSTAVASRAVRIAGNVRAAWPATDAAVVETVGLLAAAGAVEEGRALLAFFDSAASPFQRRRFERERMLAEGRLLVAEGRLGEATVLLQTAVYVPLFPFACGPCPSIVLGRAYEQVGDGERAIEQLERHRASRPLTGPDREWDMVYLASTLERLGRLYEERGDGALARERYQEFVELWSDADPFLQPRVEAAREALGRLGAR